jgi:hypothetical protein
MDNASPRVASQRNCQHRHSFAWRGDVGSYTMIPHERSSAAVYGFALRCFISLSLCHRHGSGKRTRILSTYTRNASCATCISILYIPTWWQSLKIGLGVPLAWIEVG